MDQAKRTTLIGSVATAISLALPTSGSARRDGVRNLAAKAENWHFLYGRNMPDHPTPRWDNGWKFTFPSYPRQVDYLMTPYNDELRGRIEVEYSIEQLSGNPTYIPDPLSKPASCSMHVMMRRAGDRMFEEYEDYRYWYGIGIEPLLPSAPRTTLVCHLDDLDNWTNVFGRPASSRPDAFMRLRRDLNSVGMTFGANPGHYGHGVSTTGGLASFRCHRYSVKAP